jgi:hypothetical protein
VKAPLTNLQFIDSLTDHLNRAYTLSELVANYKPEAVPDLDPRVLASHYAREHFDAMRELVANYHEQASDLRAVK